MSLRKRIKAFLRDDELHKQVSGLRTDIDVLNVKLSEALSHIDRVSVQVAALDAKKLAEAKAMPAKPRTWAQTKERLEGGMAESKA